VVLPSDMYSASLLPHLSSSSTFPPQPPSSFLVLLKLFLSQTSQLIGLYIAQYTAQLTRFVREPVHDQLYRCHALQQLSPHWTPPWPPPIFLPGHLPTSSNFDGADQPVLKIFISTVLHCLPHSRSKSLRTDLVFGSRFFVAGLCLDPGHQRRGARSHILGGAPCATITFALTVAATSRLCTSPTWIGNRKMSH
jgi:hypothetical protein